MNPKDFFRELGLGDDELNEARKWVNYKHFENSVPDILSLSEYVDTIYKRAFDKDAKPHQWFSERYLVQRYLYTDIIVTDKYWKGLQERIDKILDKEIEEHHQQFLYFLLDYVELEKKCLSKECLVFLNEIYKGK